MALLKAKVDSVRDAISTSAFTPTTVTTLSDLLTPEQIKSDKLGISNGKSSRLNGTQNLKSTAKARPAPLKAKNVRVSRNQAEQLSSKEKSSLVTEVINAALKELTEAIKAPAKDRSQAKDLSKGTARKTLRRSISMPQSPLQPRSLNRISSSPNISSRLSRSSSSASITPSSYRSTAECARIAFAYLLTSQDAKTTDNASLEHASSIFVGKMIALGLEDLATKELRILKRRLEPCAKKRVGKENVTKPQTLGDLLDFGSPNANSAQLELVVAVQLQVLRLMTVSRNKKHVETALPILQHSHPSSPTRLILLTISHAKQSTKGIHQLQTLCDLLLSLTPNISSSEDALALESRLSVTPDVAIQLQSLGLQSRVLWWNLAGHKGDMHKELLDPFHRCMSAFSRRSRSSALEVYRVASSAFSDLQASLSEDIEFVQGTETVLARIYRLLSSLSQDADLINESIEWVKKVQASLDVKFTTEATRCALIARLAMLTIRSSPNSSKLEDMLLTLLEGLELPFKGGTAEIDELLVEVSAARRAVVNLLSRQTSIPKTTSPTNFTEGAREMCESLVIRCPRLFLRYLGKSPNNNSAPKDIIRYEQRRSFIRKPGLHAIESAIFIVRVFQREDRLTWDMMDSLLQDCISLLDRLHENIKADSPNGTVASSSYYIGISNLYFTQYHNLRRDSQDAKDVQLLRVLRRSIDCIRSRPRNERKAALLSRKLEKLADFCKVTGRRDEHTTTLLCLRNEMVENDVLSAVVTASATEPSQKAWNCVEDALILARTIRAHLKVQLEQLDVLQTALVEEKWSIEEKGTVLEHLLEVLSNHPRGSNSNTAITLLERVFHELMFLYNQDHYPIRRLRVQARFLSHREPRQEIADLIRNDLTRVGSIELEKSKDTGLRSYLDHFQVLTGNMMELQQKEPRLDVLKESLIFWFSVKEQCINLSNLEREIDDLAFLLDHLRLIANYLQVRGFDFTRLTTLRLIAELAELLDDSSRIPQLVMSYTDLGAQWLQLGYTGKAAKEFHKAQEYSQHNPSRSLGSLRLLLAYSDYLIAIGDYGKSEEHLLIAQSNFDQEEDASSRSPASIEKRVILATASMIYSLLDFERGASQTAIVRARDTTKMLSRAWAALEEQVRRDDSSKEPAKVSSENTFQPIESSIMINMPCGSESQLAGAFFWPLVAPMFRSLSHLSALYAHHGMFQETLYYAEQAQKLASEVGSNAYLATTSATLSNIWLRAGQLDKASELLQVAKDSQEPGDKSRNAALLSCYSGQLNGALADLTSELSAYKTSEALLEILSSIDFINAIDCIKSPVNTLEQKMASLTISKPQGKAPRRTVARPKTGSKATTKRKVTAPAPIAVQDTASACQDCPQLDSLRARTLHQKANVLMLQKRFGEAAIVLQEASNFSSSQIDTIYQALGFAKQLLLQSIEMMNADPVYSVLQDSTISFPSIVGQARSTVDRLSLARHSPPGKGQVSKSRVRSKSPVMEGFFDKLRQAQEKLTEVYLHAISVAPFAAIHNISALLNTVAILLSAAGVGKGKPVAYPGFASCSMETAKTLSLRRERKVIMADAALKSSSSGNRWPSLATSDPRRSSLGVSLSDMSRFQRDYIDIIPRFWTAISISLSETRHELSITKLQAGSSPFVLRLPLGRNNSRDADEEEFGFEQGQLELHEIIDLANESAHDARDMSGSEAKLSWWDTRRSLDTRLKDLLENIERVWLGGFTGIFSQHRTRPDLLSRFQVSFQNILDKHLPSRQKTNKRKGPSTRITLDTRILDLFIGLGDASVEDCDFDEALTDLLYFVVDILQFHGELNAYAEIDFDSIVVETHDARRCYHEAARASSQEEEDRHTILILDKALHAFPWESLPCMEGLAVSRLPSLGCLRDRILEQQKDSPTEGPEGHYVNRASGAYILNPSGDLKHTQATFQKSLQNLNIWDKIIQREPSENEIKSYLESKDMLLYFGHGSGAQYIRAREIRKLEKCAVTMLMGCSSGALTEAGEFEPYGPPIQYMHAGCPALVAMLWDVTDKDIDRFAMSTFQHWGLVNTPETKGKGKRRNKLEVDVEDVEMPDGTKEVSLVEAIAKGREACNLRYLNAAAVCVYGVPVYLK